jgi:FAD/FMN-containing dehydrogenase
MLRMVSQRHGAMQIARQLHQNALQQFTDLLGERGVNTDPVALSAHNADWTHVYKGDARVVLSPSCTEEVSSVLAYCNENNIGIVPQGGNTGLVGGAIAFSSDEVVLSLSRMNKILDFHGVWLPIHFTPSRTMATEQLIL